MKIGSVRYRALLDAVQKIKVRGEATNLELAAYCGKDRSKTSKCFWMAHPSLVARADFTLTVLRWVCAREKIDLIIPDWGSIRFLMYERLAFDPMTPNEKTRRHRDKFIQLLKISPTQLIRYFINRSHGGSREPFGPLALELLANFYGDYHERRGFIEFLRFDLDDLTYSGASPTSKLKTRHQQFTAQANAAESLYLSRDWTMNKRLAQILGNNCPLQ